MRWTRITFLMLSAIGGCTPLVIEQRLPDDSANQAQVTVNRQATTPASTPARWTSTASEQPALAVRAETGSTVTTQVAAKTPVQVAQAAPTVPVGAPTLPKAPVQVDTYLDKNKVIQASVSEPKPDKPGFAERTDLESRPMPPPLVPPTTNVVDLGNAPPMMQQPAFRMVNTKKFTLNFEVKDIGVTGISTVDLWGTQDMRSWKKFEAVQLANALQVEVKDEGTYGFTLVAHNGNGLGKMAPQSGELPQVWVSVNTTPPAVTLAGVEMSLTSKTPSLIIRWTAKDRNFGPRPVTLSYAASPDGPWTLLSTNVENNGRYEWPLPTANVPPCMYVRVQAADLNGNVGYAQTESPIHLDNYTAKAEVPPEPARTVTPPPPATDMQRPSAIIITVEPN